VLGRSRPTFGAGFVAACTWQTRPSSLYSFSHPVSSFHFPSLFRNSLRFPPAALNFDESASSSLRTKLRDRTSAPNLQGGEGSHSLPSYPTPAKGVLQPQPTPSSLAWPWRTKPRFSLSPISNTF